MGYRFVQIGDTELEIHVSGPADAASLLVLHVGAPAPRPAIQRTPPQPPARREST